MIFACKSSYSRAKGESIPTITKYIEARDVVSAAITATQLWTELRFDSIQKLFGQPEEDATVHKASQFVIVNPAA